MRVSIVAPVDPHVEKPGGTRNYVMNLVKSLKASSIEFSLIGVDHDQTDGPPDFDFIPAVVAPRVSSVRFLRGLMKVSKKTDFSSDTIIHAQRPDYLFPFIFRKHRNKMLCTLHGQMLRSIRERKGSFYGIAYRLLESYAMKGADHVIAVDQSTLDLFHSKYPFLVRRSSLIPVGIDLESWGREYRDSLPRKLGLQSHGKTMLYVGRLEREKNVDLIINSFQIVRKEVQDCSLIIIGDGTQRKDLERVAGQEEGDGVRFLGSQSSEVVRDYMATSDVLCLASSFESGPLVVLESLASGTPVVSMDVGQVRRFLQDTATGIIVPRDTEAMANAVIDLLDVKREKIAPRCIARASEFSFKKTFESTLGVYEDLRLPSE